MVSLVVLFALLAMRALRALHALLDLLSIGCHAKPCFPCVSIDSHAKQMLSLCFPSVPMPNLSFLCVFYWFHSKTKDFLVFSFGSRAEHTFSLFFIGSYATPVFSIRKNICFVLCPNAKLTFCFRFL